MKLLIMFYDKLFKYHYEKVKNEKSDPEIMPITIISFSQAANSSILLLFLYKKLNISQFVNIQYASISIFVVFLGINFYRYIKKDMKKRIIEMDIVLPDYFGKIAWGYFIISLFSPIFFAYLFNEILKL